MSARKRTGGKRNLWMSFRHGDSRSILNVHVRMARIDRCGHSDWRLRNQEIVIEIGMELREKTRALGPTLRSIKRTLKGVEAKEDIESQNKERIETNISRPLSKVGGGIKQGCSAFFSQTIASHHSKAVFLSRVRSKKKKKGIISK